MESVGTIHSVKDQTVVLKVDDNTKIEFSKSAVSSVIDQKEAKPEKAKAEPVVETETEAKGENKG